MIALVTLSTDKTTRKKKLQIQGTLSGNYVNGTGETVDFTKVTNPKFHSGGKPASNPTFAEVTNSPAGYAGVLTLGATMKTAVLKVFSAAGVELASGAYPASLIATPFVFEVTGPKGNF